MASENNPEQESTPTASGGKQTRLEEGSRKTGQGSNTDTRPGAEAEAPGNDNTEKPGDPNQGTEAR